MKKMMTLLSICVLIMLSACSTSDGEFSVGNMSTADFIPGEKYAVVVPIEWSGSQAAVIDSITIERHGEEIRDIEGISYTFYAGSPQKSIGVYPGETVGEKQAIQGYEIEDKGTLILEVVLSNVQENRDREMKIQYTVNGKSKEQTIATSTVAGLSTQ